ncbi:hypothetical protein CCHR01_18665 [Colletotrichum chrysophilum]|uniref:Uncharacterized protein n=1 Tax=Colletotrichum chrysophilum TaxID=1836956 RepID=A0AAD9A447_9PEZI|nr:hypothetical protein CCHR01_18665 [Colletotrichum chrysophilum]
MPESTLTPWTPSLILRPTSTTWSSRTREVGDCMRGERTACTTDRRGQDWGYACAKRTQRVHRGTHNLVFRPQ